LQDFTALKDDILKSRVVENVVAEELIRRHPGEIFYSRSNEEIDFVTTDSAWEVKYQNRIVREDVKQLLSFPGRRFVLSKHTLDTEQDYPILPVEFFLLIMDRLKIDQ